MCTEPIISTIYNTISRLHTHTHIKLAQCIKL